MNGRSGGRRYSCSPVQAAANRYINDVRGKWLRLEDAIVLAAVDDAQRREHGDILEIGVYRGASAILLGYFVKPDERLVVCDLFGLPGQRPEVADEIEMFGDSTRPDFERNYLRFHSELPDIFEMPSSELDSKLAAGTFRLVHVDGSHAYVDVRSDIQLARRLLVPNGVVVIDDVSHDLLPGVAAATWEAVFCEGLVPFALAGKLYGTWGQPPQLDAERVARELGQQLVTWQHDVAGHVVTRYGIAPRLEDNVRRFVKACVPPAVVSVARRVVGRSSGPIDRV